MATEEVIAAPSFEFLRSTEVESVPKESGLWAGKGLGELAGNIHTCLAFTRC